MLKATMQVTDLRMERFTLIPEMEGVGIRDATPELLDTDTMPSGIPEPTSQESKASEGWDR